MDLFKTFKDIKAPSTQPMNIVKTGLGPAAVKEDIFHEKKTTLCKVAKSVGNRVYQAMKDRGLDNEEMIKGCGPTALSLLSVAAHMINQKIVLSPSEHASKGISV
jgi:hypothetical protein